MLLGVQKTMRDLHIPKWTPILGVGVPMDSQWTPESSKGDFRGQNPLDWRVIYIMGNLLKQRCLKWARMTHWTSETQVMAKKKVGSQNGQFDSQPLKVENWPDFLVCRWHATYRWKAFKEDYNFASHLSSIRGLHIKLWGPKVARVPTLEILGLPFGSPRTKCHLDVGLWRGTQ
jgi:hypothetical protein